ncbi:MULTISPECIES: hypothetical protein [unclassified Lentimonas]|uniref:hypothetical protein n=1 Tax=unclassified Lentimonas TaxID=2630993 RepID=UPI0013282A86|nr:MULTISPECIES: hypothetical protein [unclassified Lentimonas]CAA7182645.1 Unannotated [Lentimonas sp. CC8]CAA6679398.1 Unannotated [Lentimonas sp. CC4]CAA6687068.1 Unannotated [Lentimonas sp. CC6]CAA7075584.1 Unannotated [Lentimonas sp. CC4]CAA7170351.1 Unannotated [Lentimonas sp. CC21]
MRVAKSITDSIAAVPGVVLIILVVIALIIWSDSESLQMSVDDLTLREVTLSIVDAEGAALQEVTVGVEPMYSFDEIKPQYQMTILGEGRVRLSILFSWQCKIRVGAADYKTITHDYEESDPSDLTITLRPAK